VQPFHQRANPYNYTIRPTENTARHAKLLSLHQPSSFGLHAVMARKQVTFMDLPNELHLDICGALPLRDLPAFIRVSKYLHQLCVSELWQRLLPSRLLHLSEQEFRIEMRSHAVKHYIAQNLGSQLDKLFALLTPHFLDTYSPYLSEQKTITTALLSDISQEEIRKYLGPSFRMYQYEDMDPEMVRELWSSGCTTVLGDITRVAVETVWKSGDTSILDVLSKYDWLDYPEVLLVSLDYAWEYPIDLNRRTYARDIPQGDRRMPNHMLPLRWMLASVPNRVLRALVLEPQETDLVIGMDVPVDSMFSIVAGRENPTSIVAVNELELLVELFTDDGEVSTVAQPAILSALDVSKEIAIGTPDMPHRIMEYLEGVCAPWVFAPSEPLWRFPEPHAFVTTLLEAPFEKDIDPVSYFDDVQRFIAPGQEPIPILISSVTLSDEDAARRIQYFLDWLGVPGYQSLDALFYAAIGFGRWNCFDALDVCRRRLPVTQGDVLCSRLFDKILLGEVQTAEKSRVRSTGLKLKGMVGHRMFEACLKSYGVEEERLLRAYFLI
jgi:hypothetical protein